MISSFYPGNCIFRPEYGWYRKLLHKFFTITSKTQPNFAVFFVARFESKNAFPRMMLMGLRLKFRVVKPTISTTVDRRSLRPGFLVGFLRPTVLNTVPPTLTSRPNRWLSDLSFALTATLLRRVVKVNWRSENHRFGLHARVGGRLNFNRCSIHNEYDSSQGRWSRLHNF